MERNKSLSKNVKIFIFFTLFSCMILSCKKTITESNEINENNEKLKELLFYNKIVKDKIYNIFELGNSEKAKIFKIRISRYDSFVRITIHQVFYTNELEDLPTGTIEYNNNLFMYYNGFELLLNDFISQKELQSKLTKLNIVLESSPTSIYDSRILQFDIDLNKKILFHFPAITTSMSAKKVKKWEAPRSTKSE